MRRAVLEADLIDGPRRFRCARAVDEVESSVAGRHGRERDDREGVVRDVIRQFNAARRRTDNSSRRHDDPARRPG